MNSPQSTRKKGTIEAVAVLARWFLGGLFIYMGISKAQHPEQFLKLVRQYDMVSSYFVLNSIAALLPWFEVVCGLLLVLGVAVRGAALILLGMLVPFSLVVLRRAMGIAAVQGLRFCAVEFDCGCGNGEVLICSKLIENCGLILLATWLLFGKGRPLSAKFTFFPEPRSGKFPSVADVQRLDSSPDMPH